MKDPKACRHKNAGVNLKQVSQKQYLYKFETASNYFAHGYRDACWTIVVFGERSLAFEPKSFLLFLYYMRLLQGPYGVALLPARDSWGETVSKGGFPEKCLWSRTSSTSGHTVMCVMGLGTFVNQCKTYTAIKLHIVHHPPSSVQPGFGTGMSWWSQWQSTFFCGRSCSKVLGRGNVMIPSDCFFIYASCTWTGQGLEVRFNSRRQHIKLRVQESYRKSMEKSYSVATIVGFQSIKTVAFRASPVETPWVRCKNRMVNVARGVKDKAKWEHLLRRCEGGHWTQSR